MKDHMNKDTSDFTAVPEPQGEFTRAVIATAQSGRFSKGKKRTVKEWAVRLCIMLVALFIAQIGISLFLLSVLGAEPYTVYAQGLSRVFGLSVGMCHMTFTGILLATFVFIARDYILPGTVICSFFSGLFLDLVLLFMGGVISPDASLGVRLVASLAGTCISAAGLALLIRADGGLGANDLLPIVLSDKLRIQYRWVKIAADVVFTTVGFFLGGVVGIGTLFSVLLVGPVAQWLFPVMNRVVGFVLATASASSLKKHA